MDYGRPRSMYVGLMIGGFKLAISRSNTAMDSWISALELAMEYNDKGYPIDTIQEAAYESIQD